MKIEGAVTGVYDRVSSQRKHGFFGMETEKPNLVTGFGQSPLNFLIVSMKQGFRMRFRLKDWNFGFIVAFAALAAGLILTADSSPAVAQDSTKSGKKSDDEKGEEKKDEFAFTLENIFAEKSYFGTSARSTEFSHDGRYATYLYQPYDERRHGADLFLHDFKTGKTERLTSVSVLAPFQAATRKVKDDRIEKLKKKSKSAESKETGDDKPKADKSKDSDKKEDADKVVDESGDTVPEADVDDEKGPRYSGVSTYQWHPTENQFLFTAMGDIYQMDVAAKKIERLTRTSTSERSVQYLPDGLGFTYSSGDVVNRVTFGQSMIEQLTPTLPSGQSLSDSVISPDGKRLAIVARKGGSPRSSARKVDIIRYRDRFAKSDTVSRTVSDDEVQATDTYVYLYDLEKAVDETARLIQIFEIKVDEPRDVISSPEWSLDSSKVTFCFFDQDPSEVQILVGEFPDDESKYKVEKGSPSTDEDADSDDSQQQGRRGSGGSTGSSASTDVVNNDAKIVYRFRHFGGPNTPGMVSPQFAWDSNSVVFVSEISGFRHLHLIDTIYESVTQLTNGKFEVYPQKMAKDHKSMVVTANKEHPSQDMVYNVNLETGEMKMLGKEKGNYSTVAVSDDGKRMLSNYVTYGRLSKLLAFDGGKDANVLTDSHPEKAKKFTEAIPGMFDYENRHGHRIYGMMFKPAGWKKNKKYPLLIYVYGGPLGTSHSVVDGSYSSDGYFFNNYMAQEHDYLTVVIDPRGQSGYGGVFEKANYENVGKPQVEDLEDGVKHLIQEYGADETKVAIYGWSFGGFQTQMCLYTKPDVFQVGIAGAGPTEWENYNSWYTTGTVGPSRTGETDQKKYSLRPLAKNLKGKLLLIHGMEDTNVLFQDTINIYRELLQAGKETQVELFLDPTGAHGLGGDIKRLNRFRKYEEFLLRTIGK